MPSSVALGNLESVVLELVASGRYNSKSEVIREGIRLVEEREKRLTLLDEALAAGLADADAGRVILAEDILRKCAHWQQEQKVPPLDPGIRGKGPD